MNKLLLACLGLASIAFAAAGIAKLMGVEQLHLSFATLGLPVWFGYFIGASELSGAIGLWLPKLRKFAAAGLLVIMAGAAYFHLSYEEAVTVIPSVVLALLLAICLVLDKRIEDQAA